LALQLSLSWRADSTVSPGLDHQMPSGIVPPSIVSVLVSMQNEGCTQTLCLQSGTQPQRAVVPTPVPTLSCPLMNMYATPHPVASAAARASNPTITAAIQRHQQQTAKAKTSTQSRSQHQWSSRVTDPSCLVMPRVVPTGRVLGAALDGLAA